MHADLFLPGKSGHDILKLCSGRPFYTLELPVEQIQAALTSQPYPATASNWEGLHNGWASAPTKALEAAGASQMVPLTQGEGTTDADRPRTSTIEQVWPQIFFHQLLL